MECTVNGSTGTGAGWVAGVLGAEEAGLASSAGEPELGAGFRGWEHLADPQPTVTALALVLEGPEGARGWRSANFPPKVV